MNFISFALLFSIAIAIETTITNRYDCKLIRQKSINLSAKYESAMPTMKWIVQMLTKSASSARNSRQMRLKSTDLKLKKRDIMATIRSERLLNVVNVRWNVKLSYVIIYDMIISLPSRRANVKNVCKQISHIWHRENDDESSFDCWLVDSIWIESSSSFSGSVVVVVVRQNVELSLVVVVVVVARLKCLNKSKLRMSDGE